MFGSIASRISLAAFGLAIAALVLPQTASAAPKFKVIHSFCAETNCTDGNQPSGPLIEDANGNFYGVTTSGGVGGSGTLFSLVFNGRKYRHNVLYSFCSLSSCADGSYPAPSLILDVNGNLYGVTTSGGAHNAGLAYEFIPNANRTKGKLETLYSFCSMSGCTDGQDAAGGLTYQGAASGAPYDGVSPLFGVTGFGGIGAGVAYQLTFLPGKTKRKERVLYTFCSQAQCSDGNDPSTMIGDANGNLFGVTYFGGAHDWGALFELSPRHAQFAETVVYSFCQLSDCVDGRNPLGTPTIDASGNLVGTTAYGGADNGGVIYEVVPNGQNSTESVLHSFCSEAACADGMDPESGVVIGSNGVVYGAAALGGDPNCDSHQGCGTVVQLDGGTLTVLHTFCPGGTNCTDGLFPNGVTLDQSGALFGTTQGGFGTPGTAYRLKP
jgi:uncharacterized repeat protein (TIGR03803 family)